MFCVRRLDPIWEVAPAAPRLGAEFIPVVPSPLEPMTPELKPGVEAPKLVEDRFRAEEWDDGKPRAEPGRVGFPGVPPAAAVP